MRKWFLLSALFFCSWGFSVPMQERKLNPEALAQLAFTLGFSRDAELIAETQKHWLREPGQERWEIVELTPKRKQFVLGWAQEQGIFSPWIPASQNYDKALILGANTPRMQGRLDFLKELWLQGVRFEEIVWLTGERPLDRRIDGLTDRCNNESEAAHILWEEADLPDEMHRLPVIFIAVPMKMEGDALKRPNTEDTILAWLKKEPPPCKALFVSDQPFCGYQFAILNTCLPRDFAFDLVGPGADPTTHPAAAAITLDSIARWLYQAQIPPEH